MSLTFYRLEGRTLVALTDVLEWGRWFETFDRRIAQDDVNHVYISTVFLGLDAGMPWNVGHDPLVFETMVFGGELDHRQWRYSSYDAAEAGHKDVVAQVRRTFIKKVSNGT